MQRLPVLRVTRGVHYRSESRTIESGKLVQSEMKEAGRSRRAGRIERSRDTTLSSLPCAEFVVWPFAASTGIEEGQPVLALG